MPAAAIRYSSALNAVTGGRCAPTRAAAPPPRMHPTAVPLPCATIIPMSRGSTPA
jgi:hypothetical protein